MALGDHWIWNDVHFTRVGNVKLVADDLYPELRYSKRNVVTLLPKGNGPYCKFVVPGVPPVAGVYALFVFGDLRYIGKAEDLRRRFYQYGNISPRNCYHKGRSTNIRVNKLVREEVRAGNEVAVYVHQTTDIDALEEQMIVALRPPWNLRGNRK